MERVRKYSKRTLDPDLMTSHLLGKKRKREPQEWNTPSSGEVKGSGEVYMCKRMGLVPTAKEQRASARSIPMNYCFTKTLLGDRPPSMSIANVTQITGNHNRGNMQVCQGLGVCVHEREWILR